MLSPSLPPRFARALCLGGLMALAASAHAANILIINGASTSSFLNYTSDITTNLQATCFPNPATDTVTVVDTPPASLAGYDQVWDLRFSNNSPLTAADQANYAAYLQSGGQMFVMGENSSFITRNNSIIDWVNNSLSGGPLTVTDNYIGSTIAQTVESPFSTTPNVVPTFTYNAAGGVTTPGTGQWISHDASGGSAVAWTKGALPNAIAGALAVVFDVNFMSSLSFAPPGNPPFLQNLCAWVATGGGPPPPPPPPPPPLTAPNSVPVGNGPWGLLLALGVMALGALGWRRKAGV